MTICNVKISNKDFQQSFPFYVRKNQFWVPNFKKAMAILILALGNYSVSRRPHHVWNKRENFRFWGSQMTGKCISQPCSMDTSVYQSTPFLYYVPKKIHSPASLKNPTPKKKKSKFLSHLSALSSTSGFTTAFFFEWPLRGSQVIL